MSKKTKNEKNTTKSAIKSKDTKKGYGLGLLRKLYGLTLSEFSKATNIQVKTVSDLDSNKVNLSKDDSQAIAKAYKIEVTTLNKFLTKAKDKPRRLVEAMANYDSVSGELTHLKNKLESKKLNANKTKNTKKTLNPLIFFQNPIKIPGYLLKVFRG